MAGQLPGSVTNPMSHVPLQLIRDGAALIRNAEDLLDDLGLELDRAAVTERDDLTDADLRALESLAGPTLPERVASSLGTGIPEAVALLMGLELRGFVRSVGGRYESTLKAAAAPAR